MTSKKSLAEKRANLPRISDYSNQFRKDWKRLSQSGRYDMTNLREVMLLLIANTGPLGAEWLDHELQGKEFKGIRECHVGGDFLLMYSADDKSIEFIRAGTHAELFE